MVKEQNGRLYIELGNVVLTHSDFLPLLSYGYGKANYCMSHGNFTIVDELEEKVKVKKYKVLSENSVLFDDLIKVEIKVEDGVYKLNFSSTDEKVNINRVWLRLPSSKDEYIYGCGEQFSEFNLKGKKVPLWVSEQGVGRNKKDIITHFANWKDDAGGDWWTTYYPQPTFVSSKNYYCHVNGSSYMAFDFSKSNCSELEIWQFPIEIEIYPANSIQDVIKKLGDRIGRQEPLPDWVYDGAILGIQGGTEIMLSKIEKMRKAGLKIAGVWIQDWEGKRVTTFGKQLMWNWEYSKELYPNLPETIAKLKEKGIRVLGYINPFLALEGNLYKEASEKGYVIRKKDGSEYHVVVTTFPAAVVDLTNPEAYEWLKNVIKKNMIGIGLSGWMADFGEYLPTDAVLYSGESAEIFHNRYPALWAKLNYEATKEAGVYDDIIYFMRAGYTGSTKYSRLFWNGDQLVTWSLDDGLPSVIPASLSLSTIGAGFIHSDIGGYTTLAKNVPDIVRTTRSKELFMRWTELAVFTPVMRSHEGNWPDENVQFDYDEEVIKHFVKMTDLHVKLKDYFKKLSVEYYNEGKPIIRPLWYHYVGEREYNEKYEFLIGEDILVAPVIKPSVDEWNVYLPDDEWIHLWSGKVFGKGEHTVPAKIGEPPVFLRKGGNLQL